MGRWVDGTPLAPLQGALIAVAGDLGHRVAQPQAVLSVPLGNARMAREQTNGQTSLVP
jgi:hypothetical protein